MLGRVTIVLRRARVLSSRLAVGKNASYRHDEQHEEDDKRRKHPHQPRQPLPLNRANVPQHIK